MPNKVSNTTRRSRIRKGSATALALPPGYNAHTYVRTRDFGQLAVPVIDAGTAWSFLLNDLPNVNDFSNLYDAYVIDKVELTYVLENNTPGQYPVMYWAADYDDSNIPAGVSEVTTHQNVRMHAFSENARSATFTVRPRCLSATYRPGVTSAYSWAKEGTLVDMANLDVPFYGIKTWIQHFNTIDTPLARIRAIARYHIRCVGQR